MCAHACICVCMHAYTHVCTHAFVCMCVGACVCMCTCVLVDVHVRPYVRAHVHIHGCACLHMCARECICVHVFMCVHSFMCVGVCARACARVCMRVHVLACAHVCMCSRVCMRAHACLEKGRGRSAAGLGCRHPAWASRRGPAATRRTSGPPCRRGSTRSRSSNTTRAGTGAAGTSCACTLLRAGDTGSVLGSARPHTRPTPAPPQKRLSTATTPSELRRTNRSARGRFGVRPAARAPPPPRAQRGCRPERARFLSQSGVWRRVLRVAPMGSSPF